jgi:hypothetical protein
VLDSASEFSAEINWGDGTTSMGTVQGSNGLYQVMGSHTYAAAGFYAVSVTVLQGWGQQEKAAEAVALAPVEGADKKAEAALTVTSMAVPNAIPLVGLNTAPIVASGPASGRVFWTQNNAVPFVLATGDEAMTVTMTFKYQAGAGPADSPPMYFKGEDLDGTFTSGKVTYNAKTNSYQFTATNDMLKNSGEIGAYSDTITWFASTSGDDGTWKPAGSTTNIVYRTYAKPQNTKELYETVVAYVAWEEALPFSTWAMGD